MMKPSFMAPTLRPIVLSDPAEETGRRRLDVRIRVADGATIMSPPTALMTSGSCTGKVLKGFL